MGIDDGILGDETSSRYWFPRKRWVGVRRKQRRSDQVCEPRVTREVRTEAWRIPRVNLALLVRNRDEPISKFVTGASLEQKRAEIKMGEMGSSPNRSKCVHALGGSPGKALGFCDLLDVSRCHVDGEGWGV